MAARAVLAAVLLHRHHHRRVSRCLGVLPGHSPSLKSTRMPCPPPHAHLNPWKVLTLDRLAGVGGCNGPTMVLRQWFRCYHFLFCAGGAGGPTPSPSSNSESSSSSRRRSRRSRRGCPRCQLRCRRSRSRRRLVGRRRLAWAHISRSLHAARWSPAARLCHTGGVPCQRSRSRGVSRHVSRALSGRALPIHSDQ